MNSISCDFVRSILVDYIEEEIPKDQRYLVKRHLQGCSDCSSEYNGIKTMLGNANSRISFTQDPGEQFWNELPQRVLQEVRREQAVQRDIKRVLTFSLPESREPDLSSPDFRSNTLSPLNPVIQNLHEGRSRSSAHPFVPVFAVAATITLVFSALLWSPQQAVKGDSTAFQTGINSNRQLVNLAHRIHSDNAGAAAFGFSSQSRQISGFTVGSMLSETVSYLHDDDLSAAAGHIKQMVQWVEGDGLPKTLGQSLLQAKEFIQFEHLNRLGSSAAGQRSLAQLMDFQFAYENYLRMNDERDLMLFKAAIWTYNVGLAASAIDAGATDHILGADRFQTGALIKEMTRFNAPAGVLARMREIQQMLQQDRLTATEIRSLINTVKQLRELLA